MNYLTHFLVDNKENQPHYNFGLALPDLLNISMRGWKPEKPEALSASTTPAGQIWLGYQRHIAADASFHNIPLFVHHSKRLRKELEKKDLAQEGTRLFFVAHILLEMMIDRHIVKNRKPVADLFYLQLAEVDNNDIKDFFLISGSAMPERFLEYLERFKSSEYLYGYAEDHGLQYAVNRLLHRTGQPSYESDYQKAKFAELVQQEEIRLAEEFDDFLDGKLKERKRMEVLGTLASRGFDKNNA